MVNQLFNSNKSVLSLVYKPFEGAQKCILLFIGEGMSFHKIHKLKTHVKTEYADFPFPSVFSLFDKKDHTEHLEVLKIIENLLYTTVFV